jgi:hypothetical protein
MSIENEMEKEIINDSPERGSVMAKDMYDSMGNPRITKDLGDGEVFFGSEEEIAERMAEKREELHNK